jgi:predicted O-methyltransferase YrrM
MTAHRRHPLVEAAKLIDGLSLAAVRTLMLRGPAAARRVLGGTLASVWPKPPRQAMDYWDLVRAFPVTENLVIDGGSWQDGCTAPLERFLMAQLVRHFRPKTILEVGTYRGTTTRLLLDNMPADARIYTIDLPLDTKASEIAALSDERLLEHRQVGVEYRDHPLAKNVTQILGNTLEPETWGQVPGGIDFVFIDASHSYEAVRNDTEHVWPKLSAQGVVLWHDYSETESPERGVGKYIRERMAREPGTFVCTGTDMACHIPETLLSEGATRVPGWHPAGDYARRRPLGPLPWQSFSGLTSSDLGQAV